MKQPIACLVFTLFLSYSLALAQNFTTKAKLIEIEPPANTLKVGENLEYSAEWLGIPSGIISLKVTGIVDVGGRNCYHIVGGLKPNKFFTFFYDVEYVVHAYLDVEMLRPWRFEKKRRIKNKVNDTVITFDWEKNEATTTSVGSDLTINISPLRKKLDLLNPVTNKITPIARDLLSSIYCFRLQNIKEEAVYPLSIYYDRRNWGVNVEAGKPFLKDVRKMGTFSLFKASISSSITDFILGKGKFNIYFTTDSRRIPLEFEVGTAIGFIRCRLKQLPE